VIYTHGASGYGYSPLFGSPGRLGRGRSPRRRCTRSLGWSRWPPQQGHRGHP